MSTHSKKFQPCGVCAPCAFGGLSDCYTPLLQGVWQQVVAGRGVTEGPESYADDHANERQSLTDTTMTDELRDGEEGKDEVHWWWRCLDRLGIT